MGKLISCQLTVMDVDLNDEQVTPTTQQHSKKQIIVPVDEAHPFDLESYIAGYTGMFQNVQPAGYSNLTLTFLCPIQEEPPSIVSLISSDYVPLSRPMLSTLQSNISTSRETHHFIRL